MRRLLLLVLGACSAEIAPNTYFCGPEQLCPDGLVCDAVEDVCVSPSQARAFDCQIPCRFDDSGEPQELCPDEFVCKQNRCVAITDNEPASGFLLEPAFECVSDVREIASCLSPDDPGDWFTFDVPGNCTAVQIEARVSFPIANEPVLLQLSTNGGPPTTVETDCKVSTGEDGGRTSRCFEMTVANGSRHSVGLVHSGVDDCGGNCTFNRYQLNLQLSTP